MVIHDYSFLNECNEIDKTMADLREDLFEYLKQKFAISYKKNKFFQYLMGSQLLKKCHWVMTMIKASLRHIKFQTIIDALKQEGIPYKSDSASSILVWYDSITGSDYFKALKPWQVVNRIPSMNVLCRKAPFTRIIQKIGKYYPDLYSFLPKSYILPFMNSQLLRRISKKGEKFIIKPDSGSLGQGITIVEPGMEFSPDDSLAVAQKYIPSFLLDDTKFDLRIYVLISSLSPLEIYVYRDGLARFCSEKNGSSSSYSQITNVTYNKTNIEAENFENISKLISDVFPRLKREYDVNIDELWRKIDNVVVLTIIAAYSYLEKGEHWECPRIGYSRCFQILGFDILLDQNLEPYVIEVNYRPSLEYHRGPERRMKVNMVAEAIKISVPLPNEQGVLSSRNWGWEDDTWQTFVESTSELDSHRISIKEEAIKNSKYKKVFPVQGNQQKIYEQVLDKVRTLPMDNLPGLKVPFPIANKEEA